MPGSFVEPASWSSSCLTWIVHGLLHGGVQPIPEDSLLVA